jgi:hypothetical protein
MNGIQFCVLSLMERLRVYSVGIIIILHATKPIIR